MKAHQRKNRFLWYLWKSNEGFLEYRKSDFDSVYLSHAGHKNRCIAKKYEIWFQNDELYLWCERKYYVCKRCKPVRDDYWFLSVWWTESACKRKQPDTEKNNSDNTFKIISSTENKDIEEIVQNYAKKNNINVSIDYAGTIEIMSKLNNGEKYDAVWCSNSIWLYMLDSKIKTSNSKSTSINPVVFGIKKWKNI